MISITDSGCICSCGFGISEVVRNIDRGTNPNIRRYKKEFTEECAFVDIPERNGVDRISRMCSMAFSQLKESTKDKINESTLVVFATCCGDFTDTPDDVSTIVSEYIGLKKCDATFVNACSASSLAIDACSRLVELDYYKNAVIVCYDIISDQVFAGFKSVRAMSEKFCSNNYDGMSLGEASVVLFLEKTQNGIFVIGSGVTNDAYNMIAPCPDGIQKSIAMKLAIGDNLFPSYVNRHSTGTKKNEEAEDVAMKLAFGSFSPIVERSKFMTGHCLGATGALECIISMKRMDGFDSVMSNTFAFGGTNVSILMSRECLDFSNIFYGNSVKIDDCSSEVNEKNIDELINKRGKSPLKYRKCSIEGKIVSVSLEEALIGNSVQKHSISHIMISNVGPKRTVMEFSNNILRNGIESASPFGFPNTVWNSPQGNALIQTGITGYNASIMGCSETFANTMAKSILRAGVAEVCFVSNLSECDGVLCCKTRRVELK